MEERRRRVMGSCLLSALCSPAPFRGSARRPPAVHPPDDLGGTSADLSLVSSHRKIIIKKKKKSLWRNQNERSTVRLLCVKCCFHRPDIDVILFVISTTNNSCSVFVTEYLSGAHKRCCLTFRAKPRKNTNCPGGSYPVLLSSYLHSMKKWITR